MPRTARVVAFSTTADMAELIDTLAADEGWSRSELLRAAVTAYAAGRSAGTSLPSTTEEARATYAASPPALPGLARVLSARSAIAAACEVAGVRRLWAFGSLVRGDFVPGTSDFDFAVEWDASQEADVWGRRSAELGEALARILDGRVDLGALAGIANPYVRAAVEAEKVLVYERL